MSNTKVVFSQLKTAILLDESLNAFAMGAMTFVWAGASKLIIDHTGVEENYNGKGFGKKLVMEAVEYARNNDLKILPLCPFAKKVFDHNDGIGDVLA